MTAHICPRDAAQVCHCVHGDQQISDAGSLLYRHDAGWRGWTRQARSSMGWLRGASSRPLPLSTRYLLHPSTLFTSSKQVCSSAAVEGYMSTTCQTCRHTVSCSQPFVWVSTLSTEVTVPIPAAPVCDNDAQRNARVTRVVSLLPWTTLSKNFVHQQHHVAVQLPSCY